jgi:chaperone LolA
MKSLMNLSLIFLFFCSNILSAQPDAQEIIRAVQNKYKSISDGKATFSQYYKPSSGKGKSTSGNLYIKKKNKYRIETKGQTVVTDGITSWTYNSYKNQVVIDNYKDDGNTFSPNKYLFDYPVNFYSDLEGEETVSDNDCYILKLTPRRKGSVKSAKIWIDKDNDIIRKIRIVSRGSTNTYTLIKVTLDAGISSSKFTFSSPSDADIIDLR